MKQHALSHDLAWLDIARVLAVFFVIYGHLANVGGYAPLIPGIISPDVRLPLMNGPEHTILNLDIFLLNTFSTQSGIVGVALFFLVTGYLMPVMMEKYSRVNFLINRFFRIFPLLIASTIIVGGYLWLAQGIKNGFSSYIGSWSLTYLLFGVPPVMGILWTLVIEVMFYLMCAIIGRFTANKLIVLQALLFICLLFSAKNSGYYWGLLGRHSIFILCIAVGVSFFLAEREKRPGRKVALVLGSVLLSYLGFQLHKQNVASVGTYENFGTHLVVVGMFVLLMALDKLEFFARIPKAIIWLADLVYPIYLFHTALGLATMAVARSFFNNYIFMLSSAIVVTISVAWLTHIIVEKPFIAFGRRFTERRALHSEHESNACQIAPSGVNEPDSLKAAL